MVLNAVQDGGSAHLPLYAQHQMVELDMNVKLTSISISLQNDTKMSKNCRFSE